MLADITIQMWAHVVLVAAASLALVRAGRIRWLPWVAAVLSLAFWATWLAQGLGDDIYIPSTMVLLVVATYVALTAGTGWVMSRLADSPIVQFLVTISLGYLWTWVSIPVGFIVWDLVA